MSYCVVARSLLRAERRSTAFAVGLRVSAMRALEGCGTHFSSWLSSPETRLEGIGASKPRSVEKAADACRRLTRAHTWQLSWGQLCDRAAGGNPTRRTARRPIRPQAGFCTKFGSSRRIAPAITNSDSDRYPAVGMTDLKKGAVVQPQPP